MAVSNQGSVNNTVGNQPTRTSSRHGRLNSGSHQANNQGQTAGSVASNGRPSSKGMKNGARTKDKSGVAPPPGGQQFGRTFFHPPSGVSNVDTSTGNAANTSASGAPQSSQGPTLIDHNQILNHQFNTTGGQQISSQQIKIPQHQQNQPQPQIAGVPPNHVRAGTQIDMHMVDGASINSTAAIKAKQYMSRKEGSQDRSAVHFQKPQ